jgi:hypothetical protein
MIPLIMNWGPTTRQHATHKWAWLRAAIFLALIIAPTASTILLPLPASAGDGRTPLLLAPNDSSYVTLPPVIFRWTLVDKVWMGRCQPIPAPRLLEPPDGAVIHFTAQDPIYFLKWQSDPNLNKFWVRMWDINTGRMVLDDHTEIYTGETGEADYEVIGKAGDLAWNVVVINPTSGCPNSPPSETWHMLAIQNPPPAVPINVQASDGKYPNRVELSWVQPISTSSLESWQIWRSTQPSLQTAREITALYDENASHTTYMDEDVTPGTLYYYWIEACSHSDGCSNKSNPDSGFAGASPLELDTSIFFPVIMR